ncbi:MAG: SatD family protein [Halanaerobium sp.]
MAKYILIKGDIIKSKNFENFSKVFKEKVEQLNYPEAVINKFEILKGDEIQGVFKEDLDIIKFLSKLRLGLLPLKIRLVISIVEIETKNNLDSNNDLFKELESKLDYIGQHRYYKSYFIAASDFANKSINTIMLLIDKLRYDWTKKDWKLYLDYADQQDFKAIAEKYNYKPDKIKSLSQKLGFEEILVSESNLEQLLKSEF